MGEPQPTYVVHRKARISALRVLALFLCCAALASADTQDGASTILYFNGESAANNFKLLKDEFDAYLGRTGSFRFQPVRHQHDAETAIGAGEMKIAVLASWHFRQLRRMGIPLYPVLVGEADGSCHQTHILWHRVGNLPAASDRPLTLASSRPKEEVVRFLEGHSEFALSDFRLLAVPKDIDALMSVTFGMADAALATRAAANALFQANPNPSARLSPLGAEMSDLHPVVATVDPHHPRTVEAIRQLERMGDTPEGRQCLLLLGLDRFRRLDDELRKELTP